MRVSVFGLTLYFRSRGEKSRNKKEVYLSIHLFLLFLLDLNQGPSDSQLSLIHIFCKDIAYFKKTYYFCIAIEKNILP